MQYTGTPNSTQSPYPNSIRREYNLSALALTGQPMPSETLQLVDPNALIQSITIVNSSPNCILNVFLGRNPTQGAPSLPVAPLAYYAIPCQEKQVGVAVVVPLGSSPSGTMYVEISDTKQAATTGSAPPLPANVGVWDESTWDSGITYG